MIKAGKKTVLFFVYCFEKQKDFQHFLIVFLVCKVTYVSEGWNTKLQELLTI